MRESKSLRAAVLVNWVVDKPFGFSSCLGEVGGWKVSTIGGPFPQNLNRMARFFLVWPSYALVPLKVLAGVGRFDVIVAWQQVYGIALALLIRLLHLRLRLKICILSFIVVPAKQKGFRRDVIDYVVRCHCVKSIVCYNEDEMALYKRIFSGVAHKFSSAVLSEDIENIQSYRVADEGYYVRNTRTRNFTSSPIRQLTQSCRTMCCCLIRRSGATTCSRSPGAKLW
jgi:hypothetical protein